MILTLIESSELFRRQAIWAFTMADTELYLLSKTFKVDA